MKFLLSVTPGFMASHVAMCLIERGDEVTGLDKLKDGL